MIKYIDHHWASGGVLEFDTETGSLQKNEKYEWQKAPDWGIVWNVKDKWYILHNDSKSFILQAGSQSWRITPECNLTLGSFLFWRQFRIIKNGEILFSVRYIPKYFFMPVYDPAYEYEDEEDNDFFLYIVNFWKKWQHRDYKEFLRVMTDNREEMEGWDGKL